MADVKWIKIAVDVFDNRKIKQIEALPEADSIIVIWFKILTLAGSINDNGQIYLTKEIPYTEDMLATQFGRPLQTVRLALKTFVSFGMIEVIDDFIKLPSWEKYQSADKLAELREKNRQRVAKHRAKQKLQKAVEGEDVTLPVTLRNALDIDKSKNKDINNNICCSCNNNILNIYSDTTTADDELKAKAIRCWEANVGLITPILAEKITGLVAETGYAAFEQAVKKAVLNNIRRYSYVEKVALGIASGDDWSDKGDGLVGTYRKGTGKDDKQGLGRDKERASAFARYNGGVI